ncbi:hypothetical protein [Zhihengliuella sp.]|uniref:hypothetical protein n=1 Tax=Zhihengliuella sp. TaxID=1954483 RepID=UPI002810E000|nr:hypothetical protein [Zhihengliuella sp.]
MKSVVGAALGAVLALGAFPFLYKMWSDDLRFRALRGDAGFPEIILLEAVPGLVLALSLLLVYVWGRPSRWAGGVGLVVGAAAVAVTWLVMGRLQYWSVGLESQLLMGSGLALGYLAALIVGGRRPQSESS